MPKHPVACLYTDCICLPISHDLSNAPCCWHAAYRLESVYSLCVCVYDNDVYVHVFDYFAYFGQSTSMF